MTNMTKEQQTKEEYFKYLTKLQTTGQIDLLDVVTQLMDKFPELDKKEAPRVIMHWLALRSGD